MQLRWLAGAEGIAGRGMEATAKDKDQPMCRILSVKYQTTKCGAGIWPPGRDLAWGLVSVPCTPTGGGQCQH